MRHFFPVKKAVKTATVEELVAAIMLGMGPTVTEDKGFKHQTAGLPTPSMFHSSTHQGWLQILT